MLHDFSPVQFRSKPRHQTLRHLLEALDDFLLGEVAILGLIELSKYPTEASLLLFIFLSACQERNDTALELGDLLICINIDPNID